MLYLVNKIRCLRGFRRVFRDGCFKHTNLESLRPRSSQWPWSYEMVAELLGSPSRAIRIVFCNNPQVLDCFPMFRQRVSSPDIAKQEKNCLDFGLPKSKRMLCSQTFASVSLHWQDPKVMTNRTLNLLLLRIAIQYWGIMYGLRAVSCMASVLFGFAICIIFTHDSWSHETPHHVQQWAWTGWVRWLRWHVRKWYVKRRFQTSFVYGMATK